MGGLQAVLCRPEFKNILSAPKLCCLLVFIYKRIRRKYVLTAERNTILLINKTQFL